jgi:hypothetical protein
VPEEPMPPNTVLLSEMMREVSATPGFTDAMLAQLGGNGKDGPALMTPALIKRLRTLILGKDWQGLDRFPGWTMQAINPTVKIADRVVSKDSTAADLAEQSRKTSENNDISQTSDTSTTKGRKWMMPFWVDSQIAVSGTKRPLLVPVSHAEYEWEIRGPKVNSKCELLLRDRRQG